MSRETFSKHKTILYSVETPDDKEVSRGSTSGRYSALKRKDSKTNERIDMADLVQHSKKEATTSRLVNLKIVQMPVETELFGPIVQRRYWKLAVGVSVRMVAWGLDWRPRRKDIAGR